MTHEYPVSTWLHSRLPIMLVCCIPIAVIAWMKTGDFGIALYSYVLAAIFVSLMFLGILYLYKNLDEYASKRGLKWNGKSWVRVVVRDELGNEEK